MKDIVFVYQRDAKPVNAVLRTDLLSGNNFTIMQIFKPANVSIEIFPFSLGQVVSLDEIKKFVAIKTIEGVSADIPSSVWIQSPTENEELEVPVYKKVKVTLSNAGASLKINDALLKGLTWEDYVEKGQSVTYEAYLTGFETQKGTLVVADVNITKDITLVATGG